MSTESELEKGEEIAIRPKQAAQLADLEAKLRAAHEAARQMVQAQANELGAAVQAVLNGAADIPDDVVVMFQGIGGTKDLPTLKYARMKKTADK